VFNIVKNKIEQLESAFVDGLGIPKDSDFSILEYSKDPKWDSIAHMQLINSLEEAFDIMIDTDDVIGMSSYLVAIEILKKYEIVFDA
jgi:acyl carrier protein